MFTRPLVTIALYSIHFTVATYLSQTIRSKCKSDAPQIVYIKEAAIKSIVQITSTTKTLWMTNVSNVIDTASTKRSAKTTRDSRMFEFFFNSVHVFTAMITKRFNRMVTGQAMVVMATIILKEVV